jgi:hypothetical protein
MGGKPHQGHPRKVVEHGRVCARTKIHIPKSVAMALCGRKALGKSPETRHLQPWNGNKSTLNGTQLTILGIIYNHGNIIKRLNPCGNIPWANKNGR